MNTTALQQAVYSRLAGFTDLTSKLGTSGILSRFPSPSEPEDTAAFPYVVIELPSLLPFDTKTSDGVEAIVGLHVFTRNNSDLVNRAVPDAVYDALHKYALTIAGAATVNCTFRNRVDNMPDPDGITAHSVVQFTITYDDI